MGVITKSDITINPIRTSISEETLYIPSSDDERSEVSVAVRHAQARILTHNRVPSVGDHSGVSPRCGKKKSRRHLNATHLMTLAEEDEIPEVTINDFVNTARNPFSRLLEDGNCLQKWEEFISESEERQEQMMLYGGKAAPVHHRRRQALSPVLKSLLKKRTLPFGMVCYLESQLVNFFSCMPTDVYVSPQLSSFERMLLHSLSDYHALISLSFNAEPKKMRLVQVKNPKKEFSQPEILLSDYLLSVNNPS